MKKEENVDVETTRAEEGVVERTPLEGERASTVLGKFKDVDALERAYEALQSEFTRRSQRLKSLEREMENFKSKQATSGAEKLRKTAQARREEAKAFDDFVAEVDGETKPILKSEPERSGAAGAVLEEAGEAVDGEPLPGEAKKAEQGGRLVQESEGKGETNEDLFRRVSENEEVRLRVVGAYLSSLTKAGIPLTASGAGVLTTPSARAKTVRQAGEMALQYFRRPEV